MLTKLIRFEFPHKTASTFAVKTLKTFCEQQSIKYFINKDFDKENIINSFESQKIDTVCVSTRAFHLSNIVQNFVDKGNLLFRICQVRNPLDMIVSQYFSHGWTHMVGSFSQKTLDMSSNLKSGKISIYEYAKLELEGKSNFGGIPLDEKFKILNDNFDDKTTKVVTYENFVNKYESWIKEICDFLPSEFNMFSFLESMKPQYEKKISLDKDVFYSDPLDYIAKYNIKHGKHKRSGGPGEYRNFFTPKQIKELKTNFFDKSPLIRRIYENQF